MARLSREALSASFNSFLSVGRDKRVKGRRAGSTGGAADGEKQGHEERSSKGGKWKSRVRFLGGGRACFQRK